MKLKLILLMCAALIVSISVTAFATNQENQSGQMHHRWFHQQDPNQPAGQDPNHAGMHRRGPQKMMAKRTERIEKMLNELNQIRQTAQSENATKTVTALDKMIEKLQTAENKMKEYASDANQPGGHRFHRGGGRMKQADPNQ